jgi:RHS repeat-associated protein
MTVAEAIHGGSNRKGNSSVAGAPIFTGKERDTESGLDYFGARYYASNMGRWMSPDWADKPEAVPYSSLDDPQSLNLNGYVRNNPLSRVDADGHDCCQGFKDFISGFAGATTSDATCGLLDRGTPDSSAGRAGAFFGDVHAALQGASEVETGIAGMGLGGGEAVLTSGTVVGAIPGVAVAVGSAALTVHVGATFMAAAKNLSGGGRSDQKGNAAKQGKATEANSQAKKDLAAAKSEPPSKARSEKIAQAEKDVKHTAKKMNETSENHSRQGKGQQ